MTNIDPNAQGSNNTAQSVEGVSGPLISGYNSGYNFSGNNNAQTAVNMALQAQNYKNQLEQLKNTTNQQQQASRVNKLILNTKDLTPKETSLIRQKQKEYALGLLNIKDNELQVKEQAVNRAKRLERHNENDKQYRRVLSLEPVRIDQIMHRIREKDDNFINEGDDEDYKKLSTSVQMMRKLKDQLYTERVDRYRTELRKIDDFDKFNEIGQKERKAYDRREQMKRYVRGTLFDNKYKDPDLYIPVSFGESASELERLELEKTKIFRKGLAWYTSHYATSILFALLGVCCTTALGNLYTLEPATDDYPPWIALVTGVGAYVVGLGTQVYANRNMNSSKDPKLWHSAFAVALGAVMLVTSVSDMVRRHNNKSPESFETAKNLIFAGVIIEGLMIFALARSIFASSTSGNMGVGQMTAIDGVLLGVSMMIAGVFALPVIYYSDEVCRDEGPKNCFQKMDPGAKRDIVARSAFYGDGDNERLQKCTENLPSDFITNVLTMSVLAPSS